jgi:hypothetical protein
MFLFVCYFSFIMAVSFIGGENYVKKKFVRSYGSGIYNYLCKSVPITTDVVSSNLDQGILIILTRNVTNYVFVCLFWWCFSFIVAVSFTGGGNRRTQRKPVASHWQTLSHNVVHLARNFYQFAFYKKKSL